MRAHLNEILARREALLRTSAAQREQLAAASGEVRRALWFVEPAARATRFVTSRPLVVVAAVVALIALGPRRVLGRGSRAAMLLMSAWRLGKAVRALF